MIDDQYAEYIINAIETNNKIKGHLSYLDDERFVFIGEHPDHEKCHVMVFRNSEGKTTPLVLSYEAMSMLVQLYQKSEKGNQTVPLEFPVYLKYAVTENEN